MIPFIESTRGLAWFLGVPLEVLNALRSDAVRQYRPFKKRRKLKVRIIDNPRTQLKQVQRLINRKILQSFAFPDHLHGSIPKRSPLTNAAAHTGHRCVVSLDIKDFFPSVTDMHVYRVWREEFGFGPRVAGLLTSLTTVRNRLPQGAPTSSGLANLVLLRADERTKRYAERVIVFTRYVDDLSFSGVDPRAIIGDAITTLRDAGFRVSRRKLTISGPRDLQVVTGLSANSRKPSVPRAKRDRIRAALHQFAKGNADLDSERTYLSLRGRINSLRNTNASTRERLTAQLDALTNARQQQRIQ